MKDISTKDIELQTTSGLSVSCFGKTSPYDHPKVFLEIDKAIGYVCCPYCSKKFILET